MGRFHLYHHRLGRRLAILSALALLKGSPFVLREPRAKLAADGPLRWPAARPRRREGLPREGRRRRRDATLAGYLTLHSLARRRKSVVRYGLGTGASNAMANRFVMLLHTYKLEKCLLP